MSGRARRAARAAGRLAAGALLLYPIGLYRRWISPFLPPHCRYHPSCSEYAVGAISAHGALRGGALAAWRVLRCNPFSLGGVDPVPPGPRAPRAAGATGAHEAKR